MPKRKTQFFFTLKSLSNKQQLFFYFIRTLNKVTIPNFHLSIDGKNLYPVEPGYHYFQEGLWMGRVRYFRRVATFEIS